MRELFTKNGIYYRTNGIDPDKKTLLLIHGVSGSSSAWSEVEDHFGSDHNVLTLDLRGHGLSKKPKEYTDYEISSLAKDVCDITGSLGLGDIILVSHSFGTLIGLTLASKLKNKIRSVVFLSPVFNVRKVRLARMTFPAICGLADMISVLPFRPGKGGHVDYSKYRNTGDWNPRVFIADIRNTSLRVYLFCMKRLYTFDGIDSLLRDLEQPVLVIHGDKDTVMPISHSMDSAKKISGCKFVTVKGGNHVLVRDKSDIISGLISDFLRS